MLYNRYKNSIKISGDFDWVGTFENDLIRVEKCDKCNKYGYVNTEGKLVIFYNFYEAWNFRCGLARVKNNWQHGYINSKGKQIIECKFDEAGG